MGRYNKAICAHTLWELNMQAPATYQSSKSEYRLMHISRGNWIYKHIIWNLCIFPKGIEHVGMLEEVEIETETKVTPRQEPY